MTAVKKMRTDEVALRKARILIGGKWVAASGVAALDRSARTDRLMSVQATRSCCRSLLTGAVLLAVSAAAARAPDGLEPGIAAAQRGDFDAAIRLVGEAISAGALGKGELARAHRERGAAYYGRGLHRLEQALAQGNDDTLRTAGHRDIDTAVADFNASIWLDPGDALAHNGRGLAYWHKTPGYFREARADFDTAIRLKPEFTEAYVNRGKLGGVREAEASIADFTTAIRLEPDTPLGIEARFLRAGVLAARGDLDQAIADYDDVIRRVPDHSPALERRGWAHRRAGELAKAIADFTSVIRLSLATIATVGIDGAGSDESPRLRNAMWAYDRAVREKDESLEFSGYRNSLPAWPELEGASAAFERVTSGASHEARMSSGVAHYHRGELDRAIEAFSAVIGSKPPVRFTAALIGTGSPDLKRAYWRRAVAYRDTGDLDQALNDFDDALKAWRHSPSARGPEPGIFEDRGIALLRKREFRSAIADFDTVIGRRRDYAPALANRGIAKLYAGLPGAADDLAAAVRLVPSNPYWTVWLHMARVRLGDDDRTEFAANAARLDRGRWPWPVVQVQLGLVAPDAMRAAAALITDARLAQIHGCEAEFYAGMFELQNGRTAAAQPRFQAAADSCPVSATERALAAAELKPQAR